MHFPLTSEEASFLRQVVHCLASNDRSGLKELTGGEISERDTFWQYVDSFSEKIIDLPEDISDYVRHLTMEKGDIAIDIFMRTREKEKSDIILVLEKDTGSGNLSVQYIYRS